MPITRSASKKQTKIDDFQDGTEQDTQNKMGSKPTKSKPKAKANTAVKRKALTSSQDNSVQPSKKKVKAKAEDQELDTDFGKSNKPIKINRSPVLQLWSAVVAQFVYPTESWETCLSIGGSIASLCAISKGRAIGKIDPPNDSRDKGRRGKKADNNETRHLEVMGFPMQIKDGVVTVDGKPKPLSEEAVESKYGGADQYQRVKSVMQQALESWGDDKDNLEKQAFHFYEQFRPGSGGWGQKGELDLENVQKTITRK